MLARFEVGLGVGLSSHQTLLAQLLGRGFGKSWAEIGNYGSVANRARSQKCPILLAKCGEPGWALQQAEIKKWWPIIKAANIKTE
jgi:hypothetical protein